MTSTQHHQQKEKYFDASKRNLAIFLISVLGLFLEMLLIRWIGTEIRIFAYLQNTVLIACFLGLGVGFFTSKEEINLQRSLISLTFLLVLMAVPLSRVALGSISDFLGVLNDLLIWGKRSVLINASASVINTSFIILGLLLTYAVLSMIVDIFVPLGRLLGRLIDEHPNTIIAYSVNIAGSLIGTWLFVLMSYFYQPPFVWFIFLGLIFSVFALWAKRNLKINLILIGSIILLSWFASQEGSSIDVIWSPYQKLIVEKLGEQSIGDYLVRVNNTGYQALIDLSEQTTQNNKDKFPEASQGLSQYDIPLLLHPNPKSFLIVGAGAGNDAAGGLRHNVSQITAVEIDPAIIAIGKKYHPEHPYSSPNVRVVKDDARSFFSTTDENYDVIAFGLLDSHTTTSMTNARLDHYVYTRESIIQAKALLTEQGVMVLSFEAEKPYITDRIGKILNYVFEEEPIVFRIPHTHNGWGGVMFIAGNLEIARQEISENPKLDHYIETLKEVYPISFTYTTKETTDDWPYLYLASPKIPVLYYLLSILVFVIFYRTLKKWDAPTFAERWHGHHWHFFFLGAAFLLLEVQNISKASVVLGNTWETSAIIISGVLTMVLLANWVASKFPRIPIGFLYMILIGSALALFFIDLTQFASLSYISKIFVVGSLTTLPMFFSGIIFIRSLAVTREKDEALGANIFGSIVGALLQSLTFIIGIKALLLIVAGLYTLSMVTKPNE